MGLNLMVGIIADLAENDAEGAAMYRESLAAVSASLVEAGFGPHEEPEGPDVEPWDGEMIGYSGLHDVRRVAAHLDCGLPLPGAPEDRSSEDPVLARYADAEAGQRVGFLNRLLGRGPVYARGFDHLILHSDAEGLYVPQDFAEPLWVGDGWIGSTPRLLAELERIAAALEIPDHLDAKAEELWDAADADPSPGDPLWKQHARESFGTVVLREGCRRSMDSGCALVFC